MTKHLSDALFKENKMSSRLFFIPPPPPKKIALLKSSEYIKNHYEDNSNCGVHDKFLQGHPKKWPC